jgi:hypothetical protein
VVGVTVVVGDVVVAGVVVAGVVVAAVTSPPASWPALPLVATDDPPVAEVVGVPSGGAGARVVVVEGRESAFDAAFLPEPAGVGPASRRCPRGLGRSEATAATNARSESATASTAHQCGRIRGPETDGPDVLISPPTG